MVNRKKKGKYIGMAGALVVHVAIIALLILVGFTPPEPSEEGGVPVMLGEVPDALGAADPSLVKVDVMPEETAPQVQETVEQDIITQETEETVAIKPKAEPKKKEEVKKPEKTEAEKAEEARKLAAAKAERERKEAEEAARKRTRALCRNRAGKPDIIKNQSVCRAVAEKSRIPGRSLDMRVDRFPRADAPKRAVELKRLGELIRLLAYLNITREHTFCARIILQPEEVCRIFDIILAVHLCRLLRLGVLVPYRGKPICRRAVIIVVINARINAVKHNLGYIFRKQSACSAAKINLVEIIIRICIQLARCAERERIRLPARCAAPYHILNIKLVYYREISLIEREEKSVRNAPELIALRRILRKTAAHRHNLVGVRRLRCDIGHCLSRYRVCRHIESEKLRLLLNRRTVKSAENSGCAVNLVAFLVIPKSDRAVTLDKAVARIYGIAPGYGIVHDERAVRLAVSGD